LLTFGAELHLGDGWSVMAKVDKAAGSSGFMRT
jgi:hypothetical protein